MTGRPRSRPGCAQGIVVPDPVELARALVRCPSVTPRDEGALDIICEAAARMGFEVFRLPFESPGTARVDNLFAIRAFGPRPQDGPHICFAGHSDVVPVARPDRWRVDPFAGEVVDGVLVGRGAADMKGAIAAALSAIAGFLAEVEAAAPDAPSGRLSLLITGDEEGPALNGTRRVLEWMAARGHVPDFCLVGEPTSRVRVGDTVKIGRRGSLNGHLVVEGAVDRLAAVEGFEPRECLRLGLDPFGDLQQIAGALGRRGAGPCGEGPGGGGDGGVDLGGGRLGQLQDQLARAGVEDALGGLRAFLKASANQEFGVHLGASVGWIICRRRRSLRRRG